MCNKIITHDKNILKGEQEKELRALMQQSLTVLQKK